MRILLAIAIPFAFAGGCVLGSLTQVGAEPSAAMLECARQEGRLEELERRWRLHEELYRDVQVRQADLELYRAALRRR